MVNPDNTKIKRILDEHRFSLNGKDLHGKKLRLYSGFRHIRYYGVLYYAINSPHFSRTDAITVDGEVYYNIYKLNKVAEFLGLDFDSSRSANTIFKTGQQKNEIKYYVAEDNKTFVTLTQKGIETFDIAITELTTLGSFPESTISEAEKYDSESKKMYYMHSEIKIKSYVAPSDDVLKILEIIKKISRHID